ncbi:MAG: NAD(P)-dependent oxidoreductase [Thermodesulfovibrionales bacterium]|nr:NAD(P)-dependent oxidoreductase [Thermodesulfovibrionales bacterium]
MKVGFIGLGSLGMTMAKRLISEGVNLTVWNRTVEKARTLNCPVAESPADLISQTEMVFLNLFDSEAVSSVIKGKNGLIEGNCDGKIVVDTTTNHFERVNEFYEILGKKNASYLEAPVLGSVIPASQGMLTVLVSGERNAFERARPFIEKIGKTIFYLETPQLATKMKLINNLILGTFMATLAEAVAFGEKAGLDKEKVIEILLSGAGNSMILNAKKDKLIKEDFSTHFSCSLIYKDLHYLQDLARILRRPLFTGSLAKELFGITISEKMGSDDFSAIYRVFKKF